MRIHCLHTAETHVATFRRLFSEVAAGASVSETVRADWLAAARAEGLTPDLSREVSAYLTVQAQQADAVLCTCSTLGPIADGVARDHPNVVRIDSPLMRAAVQQDGPVLVALCLESTRAATEALLVAADPAARFRTVLCSAAWPFFERGDISGFADAIEAAIGEDIRSVGPVGSIVLAQASMMAAEPRLAYLGVPVYSSPRLAVAEAVQVGRVKSASPQQAGGATNLMQPMG